MDFPVPVKFTIDVGTPVYTVNDPYLSFNIDSASLYQDTVGGRLNFTDPNFVDLGKKFCTASAGGAILRFGGSAADDLVYIGENDTTEYTQQIHVDTDYWDSIMAYGDITGCKIVWDLCALSLRNEADNSWDSTNAQLLFDHMVSKKQTVYGFQFGNEPGHWYTRHYPNGPDGVQLGKDLVTLQSIVSDKFGVYSSQPLLFGPDNCGPARMTEDSPCSNVTFFTDIITGGEDVLSGVTVHHYGLKSAHSDPNNCNVEDFTNPRVIFTPEKNYYIWRDAKNHAVGSKQQSGIDLILGETASSGTGGCPDLSNSFAAGFWWMHTLGEVASLQYDQVYRQDFIGWSGIGDVSHYTLAGNPGWSGAYTTDAEGSTVAPEVLTANPDFFTAVLWKTIMGPTVLDVKLEHNSMLQGVSMHAHCAAPGEGVPAGAIALGYANTRTTAVHIGHSLDFLGDDNADSSISSRIEYFLRTGDEAGDLQSRQVRLNDNPNPLSASSALTGNVISNADTDTDTDTDIPLELPPLSYGFVVLTNSQARACMS